MICEKCGARIIPLVTPDGRKINCDADRVFLRANSKGKLLFLTLRGDVLQGDLCPQEAATGYAYVSHFSICKARQRMKFIVESGKQVRMSGA